MLDRGLSRRSMAGGLGAAMLASQVVAPSAEAQNALLHRPIPQGGGETLPVVGIGTAGVFAGAANAQERTGPTAVIRTLVDGGAALIDTAPSYGNAEVVIGDVLVATNMRRSVFIATKLEEYRHGQEAAEAQASLRRLQTDRLDLLQLHNVRDPGQDMGGVNSLKAQGLCRYTGFWSTFETDYVATEAIVRRAGPDFLEIDYAIDNRKAEERLLPAARDAGTAVLAALPFGRGRLFRTASGKKLPDWATEFDCTSWAQFFLKFILGHPAVTAVIPGTNKVGHLTDNLGAGRGRLPDAKERVRMARYVESLH